MGKPYNGHPSWAYWNVALWIGNDEWLYQQARACSRRHRTTREAARAFVENLAEWGTTKTPDGARYSIAAVAHAIRYMKD